MLISLSRLRLAFARMRCFSADTRRRKIERRTTTRFLYAEARPIENVKYGWPCVHSPTRPAVYL